jgi:FixJ family two-component response regulator
MRSVLLSCNHLSQRVSRRNHCPAVRARDALLTPREQQAMALVACSLMNKQVANEVPVSGATVAMHRGNAMRTLESRSVAALVRMAEILNILKYSVTAAAQSAGPG